MVGKLKYNGTKYYCSQCRIIQHQISAQCQFCGANFANYEEVIVKEFQKENQSVIKNDRNN